MRLAVSTSLFADRTLDKALQSAAQVGYQGVEIMCREPHLPPSASRQRVEQVKALVSDLGLTVCCLATETGNYGDAMLQECRFQLETLRVYLEFARILECDLVRHGPGGPPEWRAAASNWQQAADWMRRAAETARGAGVRIAMEMAFGTLIESPEAAQRMLQMIGRKEVGLILSPGDSYVARIELASHRLSPVKDRVFLVRVRDEARVEGSTATGVFAVGDRYYEHRLLGEGDVDYRMIAGFLRSMEYDGWVTTYYTGLVARDIAAQHELQALKALFAPTGGEA